MVALKQIYQALNREATESALDILDRASGDTYPLMIKSWSNKWENLSVYFKYPEPIRKVIYTTTSLYPPRL